MNTAKKLCRAGVIAALYIAFTYAFGSLAYGGFFEIRPAEALCLLPFFYPEAVPALLVGCVLSNLASPFLIYDAIVGSLATLAAALLTRLVGKTNRPLPVKILLGGLFPVLFNALAVPLVAVVLCGNGGAAAYFLFGAEILFSEAVWVYALGAPLSVFVAKIRTRSRFFK